MKKFYFIIIPIGLVLLIELTLIIFYASRKPQQASSNTSISTSASQIAQNQSAQNSNGSTVQPQQTANSIQGTAQFNSKYKFNVIIDGKYKLTIPNSLALSVGSHTVALDDAASQGYLSYSENFIVTANQVTNVSVTPKLIPNLPDVDEGAPIN